VAVSHTLDERAAMVIEQLETWSDLGRTVGATSSFQTQSMPLLHMLRAIPTARIFFLDTGYHFPETLRFRDRVAEELGLEVTIIRPSTPKSLQRSADGSLLFATDPDHCCHLNKTLPMTNVATGLDVWVSGVRRDQNANRASFDEVMPGPEGTVRYHPMLEWTRAEVWRYVVDHDLPRHPLELDGYESIGCAPCTRRPALGDESDRSSRWDGLSKTECGLHIDLIER
jgi:phosphoadenosine phosphosulfate reductase